MTVSLAMTIFQLLALPIHCEPPTPAATPMRPPTGDRSRGYRDIDGIVRVTETLPALFFEQADHLEALPADSDCPPYGRCLVEQVFPGCMSEHRQSLVGLDLAGGEEAALLDIVVRDEGVF